MTPPAVSRERALRRRLERFAGVRHPANVADDQATSEDSSLGRAVRRLADFMATPKFLAYQSVVIVCWVALNLVGVIGRWDPYPFILLNLLFSTQAAYATPILLLAGKKSEARARVQADLDFQHNATSLTILRALAADRHIDLPEHDSTLT